MIHDHATGLRRATYHWVLGQVVVGAAGDGVQLDQVVKVGDLPVHPLLHHRKDREGSSGTGGRVKVNATEKRFHE